MSIVSDKNSNYDIGSHQEISVDGTSIVVAEYPTQAQAQDAWEVLKTSLSLQQLVTLRQYLENIESCWLNNQIDDFVPAEVYAAIERVNS